MHGDRVVTASADGALRLVDLAYLRDAAAHPSRYSRCCIRLLSMLYTSSLDAVYVYVVPSAVYVYVVPHIHVCCCVHICSAVHIRTMLYTYM